MASDTKDKKWMLVRFGDKVAGGHSITLFELYPTREAARVRGKELSQRGAEIFIYELAHLLEPRR